MEAMKSERLMQEHLEWQQHHKGVNLDLMDRIRAAIKRELPQLRREREAEEAIDAQGVQDWFKIEFEGIELLTMVEVADVLNISRQAVSKLIQSGELTGKKITRQWYVSKEELKRYLTRGQEHEEHEEKWELVRFAMPTSQDTNALNGICWED